MSEHRSNTDKSLAQEASPYGYPFWEWVAREDPDYVKARKPLAELSVGEGKALAIKYREMVIIGILAFRGSSLDGILAHMRRAIQHGASKRELLEAMQSAAVPGGGPTFSAGCRALMQLDTEGGSRTGKRITFPLPSGEGNIAGFLAIVHPPGRVVQLLVQSPL